MSGENSESAFKRFMLPRLFGIAAVVDNPKDASERFPMCSGVIIEAQGFAVLVTVTHFLRDVMKWERQKRLSELKLLYYDATGLAGTIPLNLNKCETFLNNFVDVGFVVLEDNVIEQVIKHGCKAVKTDETTTSEDDLPDRFFLVGNASRYSKVSTDKIAEDATVRWELQNLSAIGVAFVVLQYDGKGDDRQTFKFTPIKGIDDYSATSGGPIFGYKAGSAIRDYCLFAIQSKQVREATGEQKVKQLIATSGAFAIQAINDFIGSLTDG